ncbi:hypothetical protein F3Y22_tig00110384pilonHSYRG00078 [Hibiscus syriacus]|uniref:Uncharacterized protein n=1 Tax=Hibiscus syriacus TaxID=106335 RepID=A0A6A3ASJ6_HIBSY|nr:hypothetical protein F3Y22_tig00110384pilonHSYRG00078 [Hibiscus syriacus]
MRREIWLSLASENPKLHVLFFPFMGHGHMIPMVDMTKLFAMRGVKATIVTTPLKAPFVSTAIERSKDSGINIEIKLLKFPCVELVYPRVVNVRILISNIDSYNLNLAQSGPYYANMTTNGIKFNGQIYDDWIEYVKLNVELLGLNLALVMDEPTKLIDTSMKADKKLWENWERLNSMMSFLKLSIAPNIKPSQPKTENVRDFVVEIKKCTMTNIVDKYFVDALIDDLSNKEYIIAKSMEEHYSHGEYLQST